MNSKYIRAVSWLLRIGLAAVFLYAAAGAELQPYAWIGYLPGFVTASPYANLALHAFSVFQALLAIWLLTGWKTVWAASVTAVVTAAIIIQNAALFDVVFRDVTILFAAVALAVLHQGDSARSRMPGV